MKGYTLSSDGTTIRHRNFESRHITVLAPNYTSGSSTKTMKTRLLGIATAVNHTSETQLEGLQTLTGSYYDTYNRCTLGQQSPVDPDSFAAFLNGLGSDHATDQKKLSLLLKQWKITSIKLMKGKEVLNRVNGEELQLLLEEAGDQSINGVGCIEAWLRAQPEERGKLDEAIVREVWKLVGEKEFEKLDPKECEKAFIFVWGGCCMHKEMNSVKGGHRRLILYWETKPFASRPVKLMNNGISVAVNGGVEEALSKAEGGATKLTSLAGMMFNHKDDKRGQKDMYRHYFKKRFGYQVRFPDNSNTCFQSHCCAAAELIVNLPAYLDFLLFVHNKKDPPRFNNLKSNVFKGLKDVSTTPVEPRFRTHLGVHVGADYTPS